MSGTNIYALYQKSGLWPIAKGKSSTTFLFLKPGTKHYYIVLIARLLNAVRQENTTSM